MSCDDGSDPREECPTAKLINQMYNESLVSFLKTVSGEGVTGNLHTRAAFVDFVKAIRGRQQTGNPSSSPSGRAPLVGGTSTPTPTPGRYPAFTQAEADRRIDSISNYFKTIMNRDVSQSSFLAVNVDIHTLTAKGKRLEEVLKCLGDAANEYLLEKASHISGLASMSLLKELNQLWLEWQKNMESLSLSFMMVRNRKEYSEDNVRRLLLKAFKDNVIIPNGSGHMRTRGRKRFAPPVHVINIGLRATLVYEATRTKPLKLSTQNSDAIKSCLAMLTTLGLDEDMNDIFVGLRTRIRS
jgi:hypothetical protein